MSPVFRMESLPRVIHPRLLRAGIFNAVRRVALHQFGDSDLTGRTVSVQGLGNVGWNLCELLTDAGAKLIVTDIDERRGCCRHRSIRS